MNIVENLTKINKELELENKKLKDVVEDIDISAFLKIKELEDTIEQTADIKNEQFMELSYENDEINRKWAEDNERHTDVMNEQQEQIIALEEENKKLKKQVADCEYVMKVLRTG